MGRTSCSRGSPSRPVWLGILLIRVASTSSALSASAAAASAAGSNVVTIGASHSGQSDLVMTEEEQETFARHASLEDSFAQREDHGGKMPAQQKPALIDLCNDGKTPPPKRIRPTQHPSTMSTMGSYLTASNSNQAGSALLSTFNDVGSLGMQRSASLSAAEVEEIRCNNALTGFSRIEKINRSFMHNDKDPKSLTKTEKAQRKAAKACRNKITAVKKGGKVDIVDTMGEMVGRNEVTLSQGDNILTPNTAMVRFDRAKSSDSEESSDSDKKVVIFCSTTDSVLFYSKLLRRFKIPVCTMHSQQERHKFINTFLKFSDLGEGVLCTTDATGQDLDLPPNLDYVLQLDPPADPSDYIMRIARISCDPDRVGRSILFLHPGETGFLKYYDAAAIPVSEFEVPRLADIQSSVERRVNEDERMLQVAKNACGSYLLSYAEHGFRDVYNVHDLNKDDVAAAFGLASITDGDDDDGDDDSTYYAGQNTRSMQVRKSSTQDWMRGKKKIWPHCRVKVHPTFNNNNNKTQDVNENSSQLESESSGA